jgi:hypothetical protein
MQLYVKREIIRRRRAPALDHSWFGHRIKRRVHLDHFEMLRIPLKPVAGRHLFRIPALDKTGIRPARCADKNFYTFFFVRGFFHHASTKAHLRRTQTRLSFSPGLRVNKHFSIARNRHRNYSENAGWSSLVARQAHNLKAAGSNPAPATKFLLTAVAYRVYIIQNREGKFYIGLSDDVARRIEQHNTGQSRWTKGRGVHG